jgi:large subunit ribosomal protein L21
VERLPAAEGETIEMEDILLLADGEQITVGTPTIPGARVLAEVESHGQGDKVIIFRYKAKTRHRTKRGHRQPFTRLTIREILTAGQEPRAAKGRRRARRRASKAQPEAEAPVAAEAPPEGKAVAEAEAPPPDSEVPTGSAGDTESTE